MDVSHAAKSPRVMGALFVFSLLFFSSLTLFVSFILSLSFVFFCIHIGPPLTRGNLAVRLSSVSSAINVR